jgi:hypothetical protein
MQVGKDGHTGITSRKNQGKINKYRITTGANQGEKQGKYEEYQIRRISRKI